MTSFLLFDRVLTPDGRSARILGVYRSVDGLELVDVEYLDRRTLAPTGMGEIMLASDCRLRVPGAYNVWYMRFKSSQRCVTVVAQCPADALLYAQTYLYMLKPIEWLGVDRSAAYPEGFDISEPLVLLDAADKLSNPK